MTLRGKVLWYERGSSQFPPYDNCYFIAVAFLSGDEETDLFGTPVTYKKAVLKGAEARAALKKAEVCGLDIKEGIFDQWKYKPSVTHIFSMTSFADPVKGKKEIKYTEVSAWSLETGTWEKHENGVTDFQIQT